MNIGLLTIGTEIVIGQIINTNAAWLGSELNNIGANINEVISIKDDIRIIKDSINNLFNNNDMIIVSGGLGPTSDDLTQQALIQLFNSKLVFSESTYNNIQKLFGNRGMPVSYLNREQAMVPDNCELIANNLGTAPGLVFKKDNKTLIALPGVPFEMKNMVSKFLIPYIKSNYKLNDIKQYIFIITGIAESHLAEKIYKWEEKLKNEGAELAYLPSLGIIKLRITFNNNTNNDDLIKQYYNDLKLLIPNNLVADSDLGLEVVCGNLLRKQNISLAIAESCTGGYISHLITSVSGSSNYYKGGLIAYSNEIKITKLNVLAESINTFGAVSSEVAEQMALGCKKYFNSDYALSITGIAGPTGGSELKPVGTVCIAIANQNEVISSKFIFGDDRGRNIIRASYAALNILRLDLLKAAKQS